MGQRITFFYSCIMWFDEKKAHVHLSEGGYLRVFPSVGY